MIELRKVDPNKFAKLHKELTSYIEMIRAKEDEKQVIIDQFNSESKRFFFGKISERALASSVKRANKELNSLDFEIRKAIKGAVELSMKEKEHIMAQNPTHYYATLSGIAGGEVKRHKLKVKKRKVVKKKKVSKKQTPKKRKRKLLRKKL